MQVSLHDLAAHYTAIQGEVDGAIARVLRSGVLTLGPELAAFEIEFADWHGRTGAVGVGSGSDANYVALRALDLAAGDEVILPPNSCISVVEALVRAGATPRLVDIDPDRYTIDPAQVEAAITPHTRAILVIHSYGTPADLDALCAVADRHGIPLIEDCSQATGATYHGRRVGTFGTLGSFSLNPSKVLGGVGDGGIVAADDARLLTRMRLLRNHGRERYDGDSTLMGSNTRLDELSAAVLRAKLPHLDAWNAARRARAEFYLETLAHAPLQLPPWPEGCEPAFNQFVVQLANAEQRERVRVALRERGIMVRVHYAYLAHLSQAFDHLGYRRGDLPVSERCAGTVLSLPIYPELERTAQRTVCDALLALL